MKKTFFLSTLLVLTAMTVSAQTTADLVRALGGASKAKANGDTVTLTANVTLGKTALVVPEGVTLDLTRSGVKLTLGNNAVLTVNGTVNARGLSFVNKRMVEGSINFEPGTSTINGSGTINLLGEGALLVLGRIDRKIRKLTLDGVTLVGVKDNIDPVVGVLEGCELTMKSGKITGNSAKENRNGVGSGVQVWNGTFTMEGGDISYNTSEAGHGVWALKRSTFTMSGGEISGNGIESASGVVIYEGGTFTMKSGRITGSGDCGVHIYKGTFTMEGGEISGNSTNGGKGVNGGGVILSEGSTFIMSGGEISGNSAHISGGGVLVVEGSRFTMSGGVISGNSAGAGGGVAVLTKSTFTMRDGAISGNSASGVGVVVGGAGGGVYVHEGCTFTMEGGRIQGNKDSDGFIGNTNTSGRSPSFVLELNASSTAKWGTGGTYTKGGVSQTGGSNIASTDDTLIAIPAK
jgi:hypothetical protein